MVYAAGSGPAIGRYPDWSPERALDMAELEAKAGIRATYMVMTTFPRPLLSST